MFFGGEFFYGGLIHIIISAVAFLIFAIVVVIVIYSFVKSGKDINLKNSDTFKNLNNALNNVINAQNVAEENSKNEKKVEYVCDYCGATLENNEKSCFACGSKKRTKK